MNSEAIEPSPKRAAYVRGSTNHKQCSTQKQMETIHKYAQHRGLKIDKEYSDSGKIQTGSHDA
jgi:DNA invertase Pin-like site-specific DNA recombinase